MKPKGESMGRTSRITTLLAALIVLGATAAAASASNGTTINRGDETGSTISCNGSQIATVTGGSFQIIVQETQTPSGAYHLIVDGNAQGVQAATPSGAKYVIPGGFWTELNLTPGAQISTETDVLNVIGQGGAPNFTTRAVLHTSVNANGDVTASVDHFTSTGNCAV
jgi:hypothetical protein